MKRTKGLFERLASFDNLWLASRRARRGKRARLDVAAFEFALEAELLKLRSELLDGTWRPGPYRQFFVKEPKRRLISAAPYRDRVVHHALMQVTEPIFEPGFIHDSYSCRRGKGTHAALRRAEAFLRASRYVLQCDIVRFFPSIDHDILLALIARKIADERVLELCRLVLASAIECAETFEYLPGDDLFTPLARRKGLPIGNLTSQIWSNVYLDRLDHRIKEGLRARRYVRYCDDFVLFDDSRERLWQTRAAIVEELGRLELRLHDDRPAVFPCRAGLGFLGFRLEPWRTRVKRETVRRFRRRLKRRQREFARRTIDFQQLDASVQSMLGHLRSASSHGLRKRLLEPLVFQRGAGPSQPAWFAGAPGTTPRSTRVAPTATSTNPRT